MPLNVNPVPVALAWETVTGCPLELVRTTDCVALRLTWTLPKFTLEGLAVSWAAAVAANSTVIARTRLHFTDEFSLLTASPLVRRNIACGGINTTKFCLGTKLAG